MAVPVCLSCLCWLATGFYIVLLPPDTVTIPLVLFVGKKTSRKRDGREKNYCAWTQSYGGQFRMRPSSGAGRPLRSANSAAVYGPF